MFCRRCTGLAAGLILLALDAASQAVDRNKEITYTEFYGIVKPGAADSEHLHLRIVNGQVFGVRGKDPREFTPAVRDFHTEAGKPCWVTKQIVFNERKEGGVRFLVADHSVRPPRLVLKDKQVDGFQWKAIVLKAEKGGAGKHETALMYIGTTDAAGTEYWLGFDEQASHVEQDNIPLRLRALTLSPQKQVQFKYIYEHYFDDGGK